MLVDLSTRVNRLMGNEHVAWVCSRCTQIPRPVLQLLKVAGWAALAAAFWRTQCAGPGVRTAGSLAIGALIGLYGFRKGSLSGSGALSAAVSSLHTFPCQLHMCGTLPARQPRSNARQD